MKLVCVLFGKSADQSLRADRYTFGLLAASLLIVMSSLSEAVIIDSFDTQQLSVSLVAPGDINDTAGSSQAAAEALGDIRNYNVTLDDGSFGNQIRAFVGGGLYNHVQDPSVTGRSRLIYDGSTDPLNVNATGLGGADLTDGGTSNAIEVRVEFADQGGIISIEVFTDGNNRSTASIPITVTAAEEIFIIPFTDFSTPAGATGPANFSNVGAVALDVDGSSTAALDVQLDLLQTRSTLRAEKAASLLFDSNGNGLVDAGDQIEYSVVVQNISATALNDVVFNDFVDINSTLDCTAPDDPATTQGSITVCDPGTGQLEANIGVLGPSNAVTITFRVDVNTPIPDGVAEICNQGFFDGGTFTNIPTDDPATFDDPDDPTCLPVSSRIIIEKFTDRPESIQEFEFTGDLNGGLFNLTDGDSFTEELAPGVYQVDESVLPGWNLTGLVCDDVGDPLTVVDLAARSATINLDGGETVTCTFTNTEEGSLKVIKQTDPTGATQVFDFTGSLGPFQLQDGQFITQSLPPGTYNVAETLPAGWALISATCDDGSSVVNGSSVENIVIDAGDDVTCTFVNGEEGSITVVKNTIGNDGTFEFTSSTLLPNPFNITTVANTGSQSFGSLPAGVYDVAEMVPAGWDLTAASCDNESPVDAINLAAGDNVTCTFTNRQRGVLIVEKISQGGDDTFGFESETLLPPFNNFTIDTSGGSGIVTVADLIPGTYDVAESGIPAGWNLTDATCSDGSPITAIDITAGETVTCTFTNQREGDITIVKNTVGSDSTFNFTTSSLPGGNFNITTTGNTGSVNFSGLQPGAFDVAEAIPVGWQLTGLACVDPNGNTVADADAGSATINLDPGESITCTFTNTEEGTIIVEKQTVPDGAPDLFTFTGDAAGTISDGQQIIVNGLLPGNYSSIEAELAEWTISGIACNDSNSSGDVEARTANFVLEAGETVTCVFTNVQGGTITVEKQTIPDGSTQDFSFAGDVAGSIADNGVITISVEPGTYTSTEIVPTGWELTGIVCDDTDSAGNISTATATFVVDPGESVRCVFTNTELGTIIVEKQTLPDGSPQTFTFSGDAAGTLSDGGEIIVSNLSAGIYSATEAVPAGWDLSTIVCDDTDSSGNTATSTATFNLQVGETVRCVFTNTERGTIVVEKQTLPDGASDSFNFIGDASGAISDGQQIVVGNLVPGNYSSVESALAGWDLTAIACDDSNSSGDVATATADFVLDPGETVTCVFTNARRGSIIVEKQTVPDGAADTFDFAGDATGSIGDGEQIVVDNLVPGTYSSVEAPLADWNLTGISCDDANSSGDFTTATANFVLDPGETVTCVFTNTQGGSITVEKQTDPDGSSQTFEFAGDVAGTIGDDGSITVPVEPGTYTSTELLPAGWDLASIVCDDDDSTGDIATATASFQVGVSEAVRCVFTNTQRATIIVAKETVSGDGSFDFTSTTLEPAGFSLTTIDGSGSTSFADLRPGTYDVAETISTGWTLTSQRCDNGDEPSSISLGAGETIICTFTNTFILLPPIKVPMLSRPIMFLLLLMLLVTGMFLTRRSALEKRD